jgi:signal transduction histidine kinase
VGFAEVLDRVASGVEGPLELAGAIARCADVEWMCVPAGEGTWWEVRGGGAQRPRATAAPARLVDFRFARSAPDGRLARVEGRALGRSPRFLASGFREVLIYVDRRHPGAPAVLGLSRPLSIEPALLESMLRVWFAIDALRDRLSAAHEDGRWSRLGRETACVAHDLRHSLTVVGLELERCAAEAAPGSPIVESVERARAEVGTASAICRRSLGRGEPASVSEPVDLAACLLDVARRATANAGGSPGERVEVRCAGDLVIRTDRSMLERLLQNLVLNALEASPDDRIVSIEASSSRAGEATIAVLDSGRGMPPKELSDLLRFGRSGSSGSGIGSASARACARALGTELEFRTRLGEGTAVRFRIRALEQTG